jgi:hypothetical protein
MHSLFTRHKFRRSPRTPYLFKKAALQSPDPFSYNTGLGLDILSIQAQKEEKL